VRRFLSEQIDIRDKISDIIKEKTGLKKAEAEPGEDMAEIPQN